MVPIAVSHLWFPYYPDVIVVFFSLGHVAGYCHTSREAELAGKAIPGLLEDSK